MIADALTALRLLTVVPLGRRDGARPVRYFALVGWVYAALYGGIASAAVAIGADEGPGALVIAVVLVGAGAVLSGFLHWDGLADCADAMGVRGGSARRLEVMRESGIGAFGALALVLVAFVQVAAVAAILESGSWWTLAAAPVLGRWAAGAALSLREPARPDGLAARYAVRTPAVELVVMTLPVLPLAWVMPGSHTVLLAATFGGLVAGMFVPGVFARRLGGITGDVLGATVLLTETLVLILGALVGYPL